MKEKGRIIFENGHVLPFGTYVCPDEDGYFDSPTHEMDFVKEVIPSTEFKLSDHYYVDETSLYQNAIRLSKEGLIFIFNKKKGVDSPTEILAYVPDSPTEEQINSLKNEHEILDTELQKVCCFNSFCSNDYNQYESLENYIDLNKKKRR